MKTWLKRYSWTICITLILVTSSLFVLLDAFVLSHAMVKLDDSTGVNVSVVSEVQNTQPVLNVAQTTVVTATETEQGAVLSDATTYQDSHLTIEVTTYQENGATYYVADIKTDRPELLRTALAYDTYGKNITDSTSNMAESQNAILAINGDYYGFRDAGTVVRNGVLLRSDVLSSSTEDLIIDVDGNLSIAFEGTYDPEEAIASGAVDIFSFGPALVISGEAVDRTTKNSEKDNPRTAIGQIGDGHYVFIVVDGRTSQSAGMTLDELAALCVSLGCETAYNLDGGGSSTLYFNGAVINHPTDGKNSGERNISDIVYVGYE